MYNEINCETLVKERTLTEMLEEYQANLMEIEALVDKIAEQVLGISSGPCDTSNPKDLMTVFSIELEQAVRIRGKLGELMHRLLG